MTRFVPPSPMGKRILARMNELGVNAKEVSLAAGLNETYVRDLLKAKEPNPRLQHIKALATELDTTIGWLDGDDKC